MSRFPNLVRRPTTLLGLALWLPALPGTGGGAPRLPLLTNAVQVQQLSRPEAARGCPARLRGVSTFLHLAANELFVQDETGGVLVRIRNGVGFELGIGQLLEIEGTTIAGAASVELMPSRVVLIGEGPLPSALRLTDGQLADGQPNGSRVEIGGVVHAIQAGRTDTLLGLEIASGRTSVVVLIKDYHLEDCQRLVDAEVLITGVLRQTQHGRPEILAASMGDITVTRQAPTDPFEQPAYVISEIRKLVQTNRPGHRIKVSGIVTFQQPGRAVFIQERDGGLGASTEQRTRLEPGDVVELAGFLSATRKGWPLLEHAVFRKVKSGPPPLPLPTSAEDPAIAARDACLVMLEGVLLSRENAPVVALRVQSSNVAFSARLSDPSHGFAGPLREGSRLRLTGILSARVEPTNGLGSFELLLRSPADVTVLTGIEPSRSSWVVPALTGATGVAALVLITMLFLRRRLLRTG